MQLFANTPRGKKLHGELANNIFVRYVDYDKDRMRIFDAWSLNPDVWVELQQLGTQLLRYIDKKNNKIYELATGELKEMLTGEKLDTKGRKLAWYAEFKGGNTIYIKLEAFK